MKKIFLSVVIPAYNEEKTIGKTLTQISNFFQSQSYPYEIIVVSDGSRDKTCQIVSDFASLNPQIHLLAHSKNRGKGFAVKRGVLASSGEYILFSDADLSTPILELNKLLRCFNNSYDIIIASRALPNSKLILAQPWYRRLLGTIFRNLVRYSLGLKIRDTQCGFKCFKKDTAKFLFKKQRLDGFAFDVEILYIAKKYGYKIKECPVMWQDSFQSKIRLLVDPSVMFKDLIQIRINDWGKKY